MKSKYTVQAILIAAAALLDKVGWCRGVLLNKRTGHRCLLGAIYGVTSPRTKGRQRAVNAMVAGGYNSAWNDETAKNRRQVIAAFRRVARVS